MSDVSDLGLGSMASILGKLASTSTEELLVRGTVIDEQFEIERVLGHGAMGVVYLARDRRLERDVAIKIAREKSPTAITRSSREAVALAKLSHPNVVTVHQVGELDGRVYVAMEYVAGKTARVWVEGKTPREILALYLAVGDGLAAAHAAGLVHRDFKPDNILVGDDGRARVADFGLARTPVGGEPAQNRGGIETSTAGTPAYMAPEQASGDVVDARSDQFSFCASMWEALYGTRDFEKPEAPPRSGVARHVEIALRRGLSRAPKDRWPAMPELLAELRRDPGRTTRVAMMVIAPAIVVGAISFGISMHGANATDPCGEGEERMARVWTPVIAGITRAVLAPPGTAQWVGRNADQVVDDVEGWTARWSAQHRRVCEARAWTPELRDRGMACLARREHAFVAALELADKARATSVSRLLTELPAPEPCTDPAYLESIVKPTADPVLARLAADRMLALARVGALSLAGKLDEADRTLAALERVPVPDRQAQAHLLYARATHDQLSGKDEAAIRELPEVYFAARAIGDDVLATHAANNIILALINQARDADAKHWGRLAEVEVGPIADPSLQSKTFETLAILATQTGDFEHGLDLADRAVQKARLSRGGKLHSALSARADAYRKLGRGVEALADLTESRELLRSLYGDINPRLAYVEAARALVEKDLQRFDDAVVTARRALSIAEQTSGPTSGEASAALGALGIALAAAKQFPEALEITNRSLALDREMGGERSYNVAADLNDRAELHHQMKLHDEALADARAAISIWTEVLGPKTHEVGMAEARIALVQLDAKRLVEASAAADRALASLNPEHPYAYVVRLVRAEALLARGEKDKARHEVDLASAGFGKSAIAPSYVEWAARLRATLDGT